MLTSLVVTVRKNVCVCVKVRSIRTPCIQDYYPILYSDTMSVSNSSPQALFIGLSGIGNLLMQLPTINVFKSKLPDTNITLWVSPRGTKDVAESNAAINETIEDTMSGSLLQHARRIRMLRGQHFDSCIILSPGQRWKSAGYARAAGIPMRVGHRYPWAKNTHSSRWLSNPIDEVEGLHDIEQNLNLLRAFDIDPSPHYNRSYSLSLPPAASSKAHEILARLPASTTYIGLHAGSAPNFLWKRWPLEYFAKAAADLHARTGSHILICGGPLEREQNQALHNMLPAGSSTCIHANLMTTAAVINECRSFISNDSGLMHVAAALGVLTFGLFGPTDETATGPRGTASYVIRASHTTPVYNTESNYDLGTACHPTLLALNPKTVVDQVLQHHPNN